MKIRRNNRLQFLFFTCFVCMSIFIVIGLIIWSYNQFGKVNATSISDLNGKKVLFDGDSIAMGSVANGEGNPGGRWSYANYIEETYNIEKTNVSIGGARFYWPNAASDTKCTSGDAQKCVIPNHLTSTIKNNTYDYIILEGSINDLHSNYYNGDHDSYKTALESYFDTVTENSNWAHSKIGFIIVPKPDYSRKTSYRPEEEKVFWKTIQDICDEYSIEYINFFKQADDDDYEVPSGFDWDFMDISVSQPSEIGSFDGLHPSHGGHEMLGEYIANWMLTLPNYKYTVSFYNGTDLISSKDVVHSKTTTAVEAPVKDGYAFKKWATSSSCQDSFNFDNDISGDTDLYACYEASEVTPTPDPDPTPKSDDDDEEDLPVPSTSSSEDGDKTSTTTKKPDTGASTKNGSSDNDNDHIALFIAPIVIGSAVLTYRKMFSRNRKRRFDR